MRFLLIQLLLVLISHSGTAVETEPQSSAVVSTGKKCPGCGGSDCSNATFAFGIPILQLIGGAVAGMIWAAIFIWIYVWVDKGPASGGEGGGGGFGKRNDEIQGIPPQVYDPSYTPTYTALPATNTYAYNKGKRGGKLKIQRGAASVDGLENLKKNVRRSVRSTF